MNISNKFNPKNYIHLWDWGAPYIISTLDVDGGDFVATGCPAKKLYDSGWVDESVEARSIVSGASDTEKTFCMRCGMNNCHGDSGCTYCSFEHFDEQPFSMVYSCFSVMNPGVFATNTT
jgi:hypothetical protein